MQPVVVTGVGVVGALGEGRERLAAGLRAGRSPVAALVGHEWSGLRARLAARAPMEASEHVPLRWRGRVGRHGAFALGAARLALADAGLRDDDAAGDETAIVMATNFGGAIEQTERLNALHLARTAPSTVVSWISLALRVTGPGVVLSTASSAGAQAIAHAALLVGSGRVARALAGGAEAPLCPSILQSLDAAGVLSRRNDDPARALRPFDRDRDGTVLGEGGAVLVLESEDEARRRGARVLARFGGAGEAMEAHHPYSLSPDGVGARKAVRAALAQAGVSPREVDLVVTHGTSTKQNDAYEAAVIASEIGTHPMVTATKPLTGHLLGAAGAMDVAAAITSMAAGFVPAIAGCESPDAGAELDLVRGSAREASPSRVLVLSHGLGGFSCALLLQRPA